MRTSFIAGAVSLLLLAPLPALAHKVIADVYADGDVLQGEIGFSTGDMAPDALVEIFDTEGHKLGETHTDKDGVFTYKPTKRIPLVFKSDLGAGHMANIKVSVEDLPLGLGPASTSTSASASPATPAAASASPASSGDSPMTQEQLSFVARTIRHEVLPLRKEIAEYKEKNSLQTILGGLGYILGLFGIGFYLVARHKFRQQG